MRIVSRIKLPLLVLLVAFSASVLAHNVSESNARFVANLAGEAIAPFMYLGAKHMVTGYDHLLYLIAILFFLSRIRDVVIFASLFTLGHSITLISGVIIGVGVSPFLIDALIGLSIVYKAFENLDGFPAGFSLHPMWAVFVFGLIHGLGLASKLQSLVARDDALVTNIVSFNVGVEFGQVFALCLLLLPAIWLRANGGYEKYRFTINTFLMTAGFSFAGYQTMGLLGI